ncbi:MULTISPECIES: hypothetical protein [Sphingomonas]|jgi:hypothetical protein|nr:MULTISPECIES: hypothetical protein [Sphingomonas]MBB3694427.1 hypothetical protein [Sphingomonas sp. BK580]
MKGSQRKKVAVERQQSEQARQRVRVGMVGLAMVVLLIGVASAIFSTVDQERPVAVAGAAQPAVVVNMSVPGPIPTVTPTNEPLAELGVTPSAANTPPAEKPAPHAQ